MNTTPRGRPGADGASGQSSDMRLPVYRNPLRLLLSASLWRAVWFLGCYVFVAGWVLFAAAFTVTVTAACFAITLAGFPLLVAAAAALRGCAQAERLRLRRVLTEPVRGSYRVPDRPGLRAEVSARWKDSATWHGVAYLVGLWPPLFILDTIVLSVWLTFLAGVTLPVWYWAPRGNAGLGYTSPTTVHGVPLGYFPHGPHGAGAAGLYVDSLPKALLAGAVFLVLFLAFSYVLVLTARAHAWVARSVLRAPADPLEPAKQVLAGRGPLGPLTTKVQNGGTPVSHSS
jgi:Putative sensor